MNSLKFRQIIVEDPNPSFFIFYFYLLLHQLSFSNSYKYSQNANIIFKYMYLHVLYFTICICTIIAIIIFYSQSNRPILNAFWLIFSLLGLFWKYNETQKVYWTEKKMGWWIQPKNIHNNQCSQETPLCFFIHDSMSITIKSVNIKKNIN
jgi:hypothetical protein